MSYANNDDLLELAQIVEKAAEAIERLTDQILALLEREAGLIKVIQFHNDKGKEAEQRIEALEAEVKRLGSPTRDLIGPGQNYGMPAAGYGTGTPGY